MDASAASLQKIEDAIGRASSPLARALHALADANRGRGTCLLLEHEEFGEALIADRLWTLGRDETLKNREHFALVDLCQEHGFRRLAVLVEPSGEEGELDAGACALALAALEVTSALAEIAAPRELVAPAVPVQALGGAGARRPAMATTEDGVWGN
ncbi:MAG: hypothetical protein OEM24_04120 [Paracoccaceae bacterium]|nr:hypothetical protein [Paracoccaceae bacterium]